MSMVHLLNKTEIGHPGSRLELSTKGLNSLSKDEFNSYMGKASDAELAKLLMNPDLSAEKTSAAAGEYLKRMNDNPQSYARTMEHREPKSKTMEQREPEFKTMEFRMPQAPAQSSAIGSPEEDTESDFEQLIKELLQRLITGKDVEGRSLTDDQIKASKGELAGLLTKESTQPTLAIGVDQGTISRNISTSI